VTNAQAAPAAGGLADFVQGVRGEQVCPVVVAAERDDGSVRGELDGGDLVGEPLGVSGQDAAGGDIEQRHPALERADDHGGAVGGTVQ
jgi:hypothetical protein